MVITLGALLFVSNLAESIQLVTLMLFIHNLFSSLQDVGVDALAVDVLQPDEVAKANGFMFNAKKAGYILGGAILGIMATKFGIKSAIVIQLPLLVVIMALPLFLRERPGDKLFPWSLARKLSLWDTKEQEPVDSDDGSSDSPELEVPWTENEEDDPYKVTHWTAKNLVSRTSPCLLTVLWVSISLILLAMVVYIGGVLIEEDWRDRPILFMDIVDFWSSFYIPSNSFTAIQETWNQTS